MNKYFYIWMTSCVCYALGIVMQVMGDTTDIFSVRYIGSEIFQLGALLCTLYACNIIENIPQNYFTLKYSVVLLGFFIVYVYYFSTGQDIYVIMLMFKIVVVIMLIYTIVVKWDFPMQIKAVSILIPGSMGIYISFYDFLVYGSSISHRTLIIMGTGIILMMMQNVNFAFLYRRQIRNEERMKGDYLANFAENSADIIFYYTIVPYPRFSFVSPSSKELLGYSPQDFYNNNKLHVEITLEEDRQLVEELLGDFDGESKDCIITVESRNGDIVNLQCLVNKEKSNGKTVAVEGVFRDVTERLAAEKKISENNRNRQLMLSYISHDLKTPITYILGYSEAIQKGIIDSEEEKRKTIEAIISRTKSLTKLVDDISLLSKLEASKFNYEFEKISCMELAEELRSQHAGDFSENSAYGVADRQYSFDISDAVREENYVLADVKRIDQVFENIFSNAVKATENGGRIEVSCGIDRMKKIFFVSVSDNGAGISEEDLPHIFENFYRSPKTKRRRGGSGLGLSLSKQIIKGHNGDIMVTSEIDRGSKFTFVLPLFTESS